MMEGQGKTQGQGQGEGQSQQVAAAPLLTPAKQREKDVLKMLEDSNRLAHESANQGRAVLTTLEEQKETLDATEDTLEATEYVLQKSMRVLR
jgi:ABC-type transporter Mla subunit MlaD